MQIPRLPAAIRAQRSLALLFTALLVLGSPACEEGDSLGGSGGGSSLLCSPGNTGDCECSDGASGERTCGSDNRWGSCYCGSSGGSDVIDDKDVRDNDDFYVDDGGGGDWDDEWDDEWDDDGICYAECYDRQCGPDGCGGVCGSCGPGDVCDGGYCMPDMGCDPYCGGMECGDDGCGGSCGDCAEGYWCEGGSCVGGGGGGACEGSGDGTILINEGDGVYDVATGCAMECMGGGSPNCSSDCISANTGLSAGCSACFGEMIQCTIDKCMAQCVADPGSEPCAACQNEYCLWPFCDCAGENSVVCGMP